MGHTVYQDPEDPNHLLLAMAFGSAAEARAFRDLPAFQQVWGISGAGQAWIMDEAESSTY